MVKTPIWECFNLQETDAVSTNEPALESRHGPPDGREQSPIDTLLRAYLGSKTVQGEANLGPFVVLSFLRVIRGPSVRFQSRRTPVSLKDILKSSEGPMSS